MKGPSYQERVGDWLLDRKAHYPEQPLHELADRLPWEQFDCYIERDYSRTQETVKDYRQELQNSDAPQAKMMLKILDGEELGEEPILDE
jgi:hypothetical protein